MRLLERLLERLFPSKCACYAKARAACGHCFQPKCRWCLTLDGVCSRCDADRWGAA